MAVISPTCFMHIQTGNSSREFFILNTSLKYLEDTKVKDIYKYDYVLIENQG